MKFISLILSSVLLLTLIGCSLTPAKTMDEFRQTAKYVKREVFNSKTPYKKVAKILENRFEKCLNIKLTVVEGGSEQARHIFNPVTNFGDHSGQASLQIYTEMNYSIRLVDPPEIPPGGEYVVLVEVKEQADKSTQVSIFKYDSGYYNAIYRHIADISVKMIKSWVKGDSAYICPSFTEN